MSQQPPRNKQSTRQVPTRPQNAGGRGAPPSRYPNDRRPRNVPPQRDPFPYIMGGIIGALVIGLMAVIFLLANNNNNNTVAPVVATPDPNIQVVPTEQPAPRMAMDQFIALYKNPATRPVILDVRPKQSFDEGHIEGAISIPEAEVDARVSELPKDRMIVAYCQ